MADESLRDKTINGAWWSFADNIFGQGVSFTTGLVLARLLRPEEYGLIGIITIFINIFNAIVDSGFSSALVRKTNTDHKDYSTMFIMNMVVSICLFIILFISAPYISLYFNSSQLIPLCRVMGIVVIINATAIVQNTYLTKKLDFKTKTKASLISSIISGIFGITAALYGYGVWALVCQLLVRQSINSFLLWILSKFTVRISFSVNRFKDMWSFGWKLLISSIVHTIWCELTQIVIGRCYNPSTLGYYTRSNQFSCIFSSNLTSVVQRVSFPALSNIQNDPSILKKTYQTIIRVTMFVTFFLMFGMAACSKSIVLSLLGSNWEESILFLRLLCLSMMLYPLNALNLTILEVKGRSDIYLKVEIIKKIVLVVPIIFGVLGNIYNMLVANIICSFICYIINASVSGILVDYSTKEQILDLTPSFIISFLMGVILFAIDYSLELSPILLLIFESIIVFLYIFIIHLLFGVEECTYIKKMIRANLFKS